MSETSVRPLRFDRFTLDLARGCLREGAREIALRPKSFEVLQFLAEHADRLVPKGEIIEAVWPRVFVTDDSLVHCVTEVRQALGDRDQRIIRTVPRRGYRFVAPVAAVSASHAVSRDAESKSPSGRRRRSRWVAAASVLALLLLVGMAGWWLGATSASDPLGPSLPDCPSSATLQ